MDAFYVKQKEKGNIHHFYLFRSRRLAAEMQLSLRCRHRVVLITHSLSETGGGYCIERPSAFKVYIFPLYAVSNVLSLIAVLVFTHSIDE